MLIIVAALYCHSSLSGGSEQKQLNWLRGLLFSFMALKSRAALYLCLLDCNGLQMSAGLLAGRIYHPNWDPLSKNVMLCGKEVLSSCLIYTNVGGKGYLYVTGILLNCLSGWQDVFSLSSFPWDSPLTFCQILCPFVGGPGRPGHMSQAVQHHYQPQN